MKKNRNTHFILSTIQDTPLRMKRLGNTSLMHVCSQIVLLLSCLLMVGLSRADAQVLNYRQTIDNGFERIAAASVSPDGKNLYVSAPEDRAIVVYTRDDSDGSLSIVEALFDQGTDQAGKILNYLSEPHKSVVSPDGNQVYFISAGADNAIVSFNRNSSNGTLTLLESLQDGGQDRLGNTVDGLEGSRAIVISPDGKFIYITGFYERAVAVFSRNTSTGLLSFVEVITDGGIDYLGNQIDGLRNALDLVLSPDGEHLYVSSPGDNTFISKLDNAVGVFKRDTSTGRLSFVQTLKDGEKDPNGKTVDGLNQDFSIVVSPDGGFIYMASKLDDAVTVFQRDESTGMLSFVKAFKDNGKDHAGQTITGLNSATGVAVSADGKYVYVVSDIEDDVVVFSRDKSTGKLTFMEHLADEGKDASGNTLSGLDGATTIAVSPDANNVDICSTDGQAISSFVQQTDLTSRQQGFSTAIWIGQELTDQFTALVNQIVVFESYTNGTLDENYAHTLIRKVDAAKSHLVATETGQSLIMLKTFKRQVTAVKNMGRISAASAQTLIDDADDLISNIESTFQP